MSQVQSISQNLPKFILKFFEMIFEFFWYNSQNFTKISELFLKIILWNFPKYFSKVSEVFLEISEIFLKNFEIIFKIFHNNLRIFRNISQNDMK